MKNQLLLLLLFANFAFFSQQYFKMPFDGTYSWNETVQAPGPPNKTSNYQYLVTPNYIIINNKSYDYIYTGALVHLTFPNLAYPFVNTALVRQDTIQKKVFVNVNSQDYVLYNFNKQLNDTVKLYSLVMQGYASCTVTNIDSIYLNDLKYHKRFTYNVQSNSSFTQTAIEGVGCTKGLFMMGLFINFGSNSLNCMGKINHQALYGSSGICYFPLSTSNIIQTDNFLTLAPNPANDVINISYNVTGLSSVIKLELVDVTGKKVHEQFLDLTTTNLQLKTQDWESGIYFVSLLTSDGETRKEKLVLIK